MRSGTLVLMACVAGVMAVDMPSLPPHPRLILTQQRVQQIQSACAGAHALLWPLSERNRGAGGW